MLESEQYFTLYPKLLEAKDESRLLNREYKKVDSAFSFVVRDTIDITHTITIHKGFLTDGKSLPFLVRPLIKKWLSLDDPSVILHDWLSEYLMVDRNYRCYQLTRSEALNIFMASLRNKNLSEPKLDLIFLLCSISNIFKSNTKSTMLPYKRYLEDNSYSRFS